MRRYTMARMASLALTMAALASHGDARPYGGVRHLGNHGFHMGGAMPGSGHRGGHRRWR